MKLAHASLIVLFLPALAVADEAAKEARDLTYEQHVRPILKAYCLDCHGAQQELEGGLDLRLRRLMVQGGESGPAIAPGDANSSLVVQRMRAEEMPPSEKKVPADQVEIIARWIAAGAPTVRPEPEKIDPGIGITEEDRAFWSFQPIRRPAIRTARPEERARTAVDVLLLDAMSGKGLGFSPDADKLTLIRRASLDLLGLPPTQAEIDQFLADQSPDAYEKLVDRLLASPHYGERWARHWLDVAGYADSDGFANDPVRKYAYKYRDYVIRSFNADKPFNQFVAEQLAGDEQVSGPYTNLSPEAIEKLTATGFLRTAADGTTSGGDQELARNQVVADTIKIVSTSLLGMTVACAQCHDHRYDPISQEDYYRFRAVFEPALDVKQWRGPDQRLVSLYTDADRAKAAEVEAQASQIATERAAKQAEFMAAALEQELTKFPEASRAALREASKTPPDKRTPEQVKLLKENPSADISPGVLYQYNQAAADELKKFDERIAAVRATKPVEDFLSVLNEVPGHGPLAHLFHRGDHRQPKQAVRPGDLTIAAPPGQRLEIPEDDPALPTTGRRSALARHLMSGQHPLTGRVLANWIWLHHLGRGIVSTPDDFGALGAKPTHPELLDFLADEFPRQGWSLKAMHRLILTSTVYRQATQRRPEADAIDPENVYCHRMPLRRLEAEAIRDRMLLASGTLDRTMFGAPVEVTEDAVGQVVVASNSPRRSIYLQVRRTKPVSFLTAFDAPVMETNCAARQTSTVSPQALMLMNSDFVLSQAKLMAERCARESKEAMFALEAVDFPNVRSPWHYGYGRYDAVSGRVVDFQPLPHWTGSAWQGGPQLPDPALGWVLLNATGGHVGDAQHCAVRRWVAPQAGVLTIEGKLQRASENGDGVRARIVSSRHGAKGEWSIANGEVATEAGQIEVQAGDTIDLVADCIENPNSDSFQWTTQLNLASATGASIGKWNSATEFAGPPGLGGPPLAQQVAHAWQIAFQRRIRPDELRLSAQFLADQFAALQASGSKDPALDAMTSLCQQLLSANEFLYVD